MVETDIANCFEAIPVEKLMQAVEERVCDQSVLKLLRVILRAGVMQGARGWSGVLPTVLATARCPPLAGWSVARLSPGASCAITEGLMYAFRMRRSRVDHRARVRARLWHEFWHDDRRSRSSRSASGDLRCAVGAGSAPSAFCRHPRNA